MKEGRTRILAVIDPTRTDQWALQKAVLMAKGRDDAEIIALLSTYRDAACEDPAELQAAELRRNSIWLEEIISGFADSGVAIDTTVVWDEDWRDAICAVAHEQQVSLVVKRASRRPNSLAGSDRHLIRSLNCALLLVKHSPTPELHKVLLALDLNAIDEDHAALNNAIIDLGQRIRGFGDGMELHAVSVYPDSDKFVHPQDLAKKLDINRAHAHVQRGKAGDIIPGLANRIGANLVIVGSVGRRGLLGMTVGNTSEKILTDIHSDVMVLVREERVARCAA
jgi:universal stress protein E